MIRNCLLWLLDKLAQFATLGAVRVPESWFA